MCPGQAVSLEIDNRYDLNGNNRLDPGAEVDVYVKHQLDATLAKYDENLNGILDPIEARKHSTGLSQSDDFELAKSDVLADSSSGNIAIQTGKPSAGKPDAGWKRDFILQSKFLGASVLSAPRNGQNLNGVTPATISYNRNYEADREVFSASGAAFFSWRRDFTARRLTSAAILAGVEFDRTEVSGSPGPSEKDSLIFRFGGEFEWTNSADDALIDLQYLRGNVGWITDSDFDLSVLTAQLQYQPFFVDAANGAPRQIAGSSLRYRWRPEVRAEYQHVIDADNRPQFTQDDNYLFLGAAVGLQLDFAPRSSLERVSFSLNYQYLEDFLSTNNSTDYLEALLSYRLSPKGNATISLGYKKG